jgi:hypothetical protein
MTLTLNSLTMSDVEVAIDALETDVATLQTDMAVIDDNLRTTAIVDMANDDYTMTVDEANAAVKALVNVGDGTKTLTWPTAADTTMAKSQTITSQFAANPVTLECETGGTTAVLFAGIVTELVVAPGTGITLMSQQYGHEANDTTNGVSETDLATNQFSLGDCGYIIVANSTTGAQAWTIDTTANAGWKDNATFKVHVPAGCDGITVTGEAGVTLYPTSVAIAASGMKQFCKKGSTDTWYAI